MLPVYNLTKTTPYQLTGPHITASARCSGYQNLNGWEGTAGTVVVKNFCPAGQNWTLSGSTCTRPDCLSYQSRDASTGQCSCPVGKTDSGSACVTVCPTGYHPFTPDDGRCEKDCIGNQFQDSSGVCKCSPSANKVYALTAELGASPGCDGGCKTTSFMGTLYCPKSAAPLANHGSLPSGMTCYGYGGRTGDTCTPRRLKPSLQTLTALKLLPPKKRQIVSIPYRAK